MRKIVNNTNKYIVFYKTNCFCNKKYIKNVKYRIVDEDLFNYYLSLNKDGFSICISKQYENINYYIGFMRQ